MTIFNYTLNGIDLGFILFFALLAVFGYRKGIFLSVLGFIRWSFGMLLCFFVSSKYSLGIYNGYVKPKALEYINQKIVTSTNLDEISKNLGELQQSLPKALEGTVDLSKINLSSADAAKTILENVFEPALITLTKVCVFLAVFAVFFLITGIIILVIRNRNKKKDKDGDSKLRKTDKLFGLLFGAVKAAVIICAVTAAMLWAVEYYENNGVTNSFVEYVKASSLVQIISEINPFNAITEGLI
ncbi:MAG: CvpA family protein [Eubacterium sp.]|nr:CvpA family protein [Eubacterium sp.]